MTTNLNSLLKEQSRIDSLLTAARELLVDVKKQKWQFYLTQFSTVDPQFKPIIRHQIDTNTAAIGKMYSDVNKRLAKLVQIHMKLDAFEPQPLAELLTNLSIIPPAEGVFDKPTKQASAGLVKRVIGVTTCLASSICHLQCLLRGIKKTENSLKAAADDNDAKLETLEQSLCDPDMHFTLEEANLVRKAVGLPEQVEEVDIETDIDTLNQTSEQTPSDDVVSVKDLVLKVVQCLELIKLTLPTVDNDLAIEEDCGTSKLIVSICDTLIEKIQQLRRPSLVRMAEGIRHTLYNVLIQQIKLDKNHLGVEVTLNKETYSVINGIRNSVLEVIGVEHNQDDSCSESDTDGSDTEGSEADGGDAVSDGSSDTDSIVSVCSNSSCGTCIAQAHCDSNQFFDNLPYRTDREEHFDTTMFVKVVPAFRELYGVKPENDFIFPEDPHYFTEVSPNDNTSTVDSETSSVSSSDESDDGEFILSDISSDNEYLIQKVEVSEDDDLKPTLFDKVVEKIVSKTNILPSPDLLEG